VFVVSGPGPIGFHLFLGKEHGQSNENQGDNPIIKALRFLTICTISVAFATVASAQVYSRTAHPGASAANLNGALVTLPAEAAAGPNYGLFTCQLIGDMPPGEDCYDPYQIRHAYNIDTLISAGFDGRGKTIVITINNITIFASSGDCSSRLHTCQ
jgi:hypothetical protein